MIPLTSAVETVCSEYLAGEGLVNANYAAAMDALEGMGLEELRGRWRAAKRTAALDAFSFLLDPKTFRTTPTDWIPRIIPQGEWAVIGAGVEQRLKA